MKRAVFKGLQLYETSWSYFELCLNLQLRTVTILAMLLTGSQGFPLRSSF